MATDKEPSLYMMRRNVDDPNKKEPIKVTLQVANQNGRESAYQPQDKPQTGSSFLSPTPRYRKILFGVLGTGLVLAVIPVVLTYLKSDDESPSSESNTIGGREVSGGSNQTSVGVTNTNPSTTMSIYETSTSTTSTRATTITVNITATTATTTTIANTTSTTCAPASGWTLEDNGYYYRNSSQKLTWEESQENCESLGGDLAYRGIRGNESQALRKRVVSENRVWIGLSRANESANWYWVDGTLAADEDIFWQADEPNNYNGIEHCGVIYNLYGMTEDFPCNWTRLGLCETDTLPCA